MKYLLFLFNFIFWVSALYVVMRCELCINEHRASAAVQTSHSEEAIFTAMWYVSNKAEIVYGCYIHPLARICGFYLLSVRHGFPAWR